MSEAGTLRDIAANKPATKLDGLDRAMVVFRHPPDTASGRLETKYRRVDLVVVNWHNWGTAVVGVRAVFSLPSLSLSVAVLRPLRLTSSDAPRTVDGLDAV